MIYLNQLATESKKGNRPLSILCSLSYPEVLKKSEVGSRKSEVQFCNGDLARNAVLGFAQVERFLKTDPATKLKAVLQGRGLKAKFLIGK